MDLAISVASSGDRADVPLLVDVEVDTTVAELAGALGEPDLYLGGKRLKGGDSLSEAGLLSGAAVAAGKPAVKPLDRSGPVEVAVVSGPAAGVSVRVKPGDRVTVGRSGRCELRIDDPSVSRGHARISIDADGAGIRDLGSSHGVGFESRRISGDQRLAPGDVVTIGDSVVTVRAVGPAETLLDPPGPDGVRGFHRPPRIPVAGDDPELECPAEPEVPTGSRFPLVSVVAPALIGGALAFVFRNPMFLAFIALSPVFAASNYFSDRRHGRADYRAKRAAYERARTDFDEHLAAGVAAEEKRRRENQPDPAAIHRIATTHSARLWEHRPADPDFLHLRIGLHDTTAGLRVRSRANPVGSTGEPPVARLVPASFDLRAAGVAGVAAPRPARLALARSLLTGAAVLHSPAELRMVILTGPDEAADWEWATWLPHLIPPDARWECRRLVGASRAQVETRLGELLHLIDERDALSGSDLRDGPGPGPAFLVVVDGARRMRALEGLAELLRRGPRLGVVALCLEAAGTSLPAESRMVIEGSGRLALRSFGAGPVEGVIGDGISAPLAREIARALAPVRDATPAAKGQTDLPPTVRLLDLLGCDDPTPAAVVRAWHQSRGSDTRAVIGAGCDGPFVVDLVRDGPHGLVAGTTGAGKSELLQSLVAGLALTNRPDRLNFVLVDYKGGSAFNDCARLPHCVGLVTDLDGHLAGRALESLSAELKRREAILAAAGQASVEAYWARGCRRLGRAAGAARAAEAAEAGHRHRRVRHSGGRSP